MIKSSRCGRCGRLLGGELAVIAEQGPEDVDESAGEGEEGLGVDESFGAFAIVIAARGSVGAKAGQRGQVEHSSQSAVVTFRATQVTGDSAGILWHRD